MKITCTWAAAVLLMTMTGAASAAVMCPSGASYDSKLGFCQDGTNAYGPFPAAMVSACQTGGGGPACTNTGSYTVGPVTLSLPRWSLGFTRNLRGTATCPSGTWLSAKYDNQCAETLNGVTNLYAGFPTDEAQRCTELGGGPACYSTRWNADFYLRVAFQHKLVNNLTAAWANSGIPSVSVSVSTPDQGVVHAAVGRDQKGNAVDAAVGQYRWASVTKNWTTSIIMKLQEQGKLNIDDKLSQHLIVPNLAYGATMTIRQMLNHSAGVGDYLDDSVSFLNSTNTWQLYSNNQIVSYINEVGPRFTPGSGYSYSNGGFFLLGMLIEAKTGLTIDQAFSQYIVQPMGLSRSFLDVSSSPSNRIPNLVESPRAYAYSTTSVKGAGALVTTSDEMAAYMRKIYGGGFLSSSSISAMQAPSARNSNYGLGTIRFTASDGTMYYGHTGTLLNYKSLAYYIPSMKASVALTMNDYPSSTALSNIEDAVYNTVSAQYHP